MEFDDDRIRQLTDMVAYVARVLFFSQHALSSKLCFYINLLYTLDGCIFSLISDVVHTPFRFPHL
jgi:hypothetical protein